MKNLLNLTIFLALFMSLAACGQSIISTPSLAPSPIATATVTITPSPSEITTATFEPTPKPTYVRPTLIPTIDRALLHGLLSNAFSIQTLDMKGYNTQRITGWDPGFGGGPRTRSCRGFYWLDTNHLLLYPKAGQREDMTEMDLRVVDFVPQPAVINIDSRNVWFPPTDTINTQACNRVYWSQDLGILINPESHDGVSNISTYTYDGAKLASYPGSLSDISPSGRKILLADETVIDLQTNKKMELNWNLQDYWEFNWSSDETRIYRCCYFYADLAKGISHRFTTSDFLDRQGNQMDYEGLSLYRGQWVLGDKFILVWWLPVDDGDAKYLPMFDPATKVLYDVRELAGIPEEFTSLYTPVSPDGNYVWMEGWNESYLVNLTTFESQQYTYPNPYSYPDTDWSADSKFTWFEIYDPDSKSTEVSILSISDMKLSPIPVTPQYESEHLWHPTDNTVVYPSKDKNSLIFLDTSTMSFRELPFKDQEAHYKISDIVWSPNGEKLTFVTESNVLWQVDYPSLENLKQIMASAFPLVGLQWSPDGNSIAFISDSDIYIVDTIK